MQGCLGRSKGSWPFYIAFDFGFFFGKCWLVRPLIKLRSFSRSLLCNISGESKASFKSLKKGSMLSCVIRRIYGRCDVLIVGVQQYFTQRQMIRNILLQNNNGYIASKCGVNVDVIDDGTAGCTYSCRFGNKLHAANTINVINIISNVFRCIHFIIVNM